MFHTFLPYSSTKLLDTKRGQDAVIEAAGGSLFGFYDPRNIDETDEQRFRWNDASGNERHLVCPPGEGTPSYLRVGSMGTPAVSFVAADSQYLQSESTDWDVLIDDTSDMTVIGVVAGDGGDPGAIFATGSDTNSNLFNLTIISGLGPTDPDRVVATSRRGSYLNDTIVSTDVDTVSFGAGFFLKLGSPGMTLATRKLGVDAGERQPIVSAPWAAPASAVDDEYKRLSVGAIPWSSFFKGYTNCQISCLVFLKDATDEQAAMVREAVNRYYMGIGGLTALQGLQARVTGYAGAEPTLAQDQSGWNNDFSTNGSGKTFGKINGLNSYLVEGTLTQTASDAPTTGDVSMYGVVEMPAGGLGVPISQSGVGQLEIHAELGIRFNAGSWTEWVPILGDPLDSKVLSFSVRHTAGGETELEMRTADQLVASGVVSGAGSNIFTTLSIGSFTTASAFLLGDMAVFYTRLDDVQHEQVLATMRAPFGLPREVNTPLGPIITEAQENVTTEDEDFIRTEREE